MKTAGLFDVEVPAAPAARGSAAPIDESDVAAAIATLDGVFITAGLASITSSAEGWTAILTRLDHPGGVASMFFARGMREVRLRLEDGREAHARIAATAFTAGNERECRLIGLNPLTKGR
jgi:hypothetical protein